MGKYDNIVGMKFNRLTAVSVAAPTLDNKGRKVPRCVFACDCGNVVELSRHNVIYGKSKSCGCISAENLLRRNTTHGLSKNPAYKHWKGMHKRCNAKEGKYAKVYYEKGITVCDEFKSFPAFLTHIGEKPESVSGERWSVGRIDNLRGYEIGNVRWETDKEQSRNHSLQSNNTSGIVGVQCRYTHKGKYKTWDACWKDENGTDRVKSFSVNKYGEEGAKRLAIEARESAIFKLTQQGVFYAESHGKVNNKNDTNNNEETG